MILNDHKRDELRFRTSKISAERAKSIRTIPYILGETFASLGPRSCYLPVGAHQASSIGRLFTNVAKPLVWNMCLHKLRFCDTIV